MKYKNGCALHKLCATEAYDGTTTVSDKETGTFVSIPGDPFKTLIVINSGNSNEPIYMHLKLIMVDDRFLSENSSKDSNRGMGFDGELSALTKVFCICTEASRPIWMLRNFCLGT